MIPGVEGCEFASSLREPIEAAGYALGGLLVLIGLAVLIPALSDQSQEPSRTTTVPPSAPRAVRQLSAPVVDVDAAAAPDRGVRYGGPADRVAVQLGIAAHAGHCRTVVAIARQVLAEDAPALVLATIRRDAAVARCLGYRM